MRRTFKPTNRRCYVAHVVWFSAMIGSSTEALLQGNISAVDLQRSLPPCFREDIRTTAKSRCRKLKIQFLPRRCSVLRKFPPSRVLGINILQAENVVSRRSTIWHPSLKAECHYLHWDLHSSVRYLCHFLSWEHKRDPGLRKNACIRVFEKGTDLCKLQEG